MSRAELVERLREVERLLTVSEGQRRLHELIHEIERELLCTINATKGER